VDQWNTFFLSFFNFFLVWVGMFSNCFYKHFPSNGHLAAYVKEADIHRKPWFSTHPIHRISYETNLVWLHTPPPTPETIQQHNNLIHNLQLHYLEQRETPRDLRDHLVFFIPPWDALIAREGALPRDGESDSVKRVPKGEKKWSHPVSYCDIHDV
jgi:hypothetical protein